jgi:hypothetical protein
MSFVRARNTVVFAAESLFVVSCFVACDASSVFRREQSLTSGASGLAAAPAGLTPAGYVATPQGYFHPSCVIHVGADEQQQADGRIVHANGSVRTVAPCQYPRYDKHGNAIAPDESPPTVSGWVESSGDQSHGALQYISAHWNVPSAPTSGSGQVYYFPGLQDLENPNTTVLQPVLGWNQKDGPPGWSIGSWNCCVAGNISHSEIIAVNAGDQLYGSVAGTNCHADTGQCDTWQVVTTDLTTNRVTPYSTVSYGQRFDWSFGGVLEASGINDCTQFPASGSVTFSSILVQEIGGAVANIAWPRGLGSASPSCSYVFQGGNAVTVNTFTRATQCGQLTPGQGLDAGQTLTSCDGLESLKMQTDGNLVLYHDTSAPWASNTSGSTGYAAVLQHDGNFVLYDTEGAPLWSSGTFGHAVSRLALQNDGNLVLFDTANKPIWTSNTVLPRPAGCRLMSGGQALERGQSLAACGANLNLTMQSDGNLVLYVDGSTPIWASNTAGSGAYLATMQSDGNLVLYRLSDDAPVWSTETAGHPLAYLAVQSDGNAVVYSGDGGTLWASGSTFSGPSVCGELDGNHALSSGQSLYSCDDRYHLDMQTDGNLVLYDVADNPLWSSNTHGTNGYVAVMQGDGNFVVYNRTDDRALWSSGTSGLLRGRLNLQTDGNLVVYDIENVRYWASNTVESCGGTTCGTRCCPANAWCGQNDRCCTRCGFYCPC